jgi:hypothetical protein
VSASSIDNCIPNAASGFTFGRTNRSTERTKQFPWNVLMERAKNKWIKTMNEDETKEKKKKE